MEEIEKLKEDLKFYKDVVKTLVERENGKFLLMDANILPHIKDWDSNKFVELCSKNNVAIVDINKPNKITIIDRFFEINESKPISILIDYIDRYNQDLWKTLYRDINPLGKITDEKVTYLKNKFLENGK